MIRRISSRVSICPAPAFLPRQTARHACSPAALAAPRDGIGTHEERGPTTGATPMAHMRGLGTAARLRVSRARRIRLVRSPRTSLATPIARMSEGRVRAPPSPRAASESPRSRPSRRGVEDRGAPRRDSVARLRMCSSSCLSEHPRPELQHLAAVVCMRRRHQHVAGRRGSTGES